MKHMLGMLMSGVHAKRFVSGLAVVTVALTIGTGPTIADPKDDLTRGRSDFDNFKSKFEDTSRRVDDYLAKTKKLREMDKTELDALITQICRLDIARDDDEVDRLAKSIRDKIIENVQREYDSVVSDGDHLLSDIEDQMNGAKSLLSSAKSLISYDEVKDDADRLANEEADTVERVNKVWAMLQVDYKTLTNIKQGVMNGSNNPLVRAAMEYGKEKHKYNQQICEEKELTLSSGRPDCVSFQKDHCIVWEFKPDSYTESEAKSQAEKYLSDVQDKFKADPRAAENCAKDPDGKPIFEARGVTYPQCNKSRLQN